jgi:hypothetical protein
VKGGDNVRIRGPVEANVAVADLNEMKLSVGLPHILSECLRTQNASADGPEDARAGPGHAFEKSTTVNAVVNAIVSDELSHVCSTSRSLN